MFSRPVGGIITMANNRIVTTEFECAFLFLNSPI